MRHSFHFFYGAFRTNIQRQPADDRMAVWGGKNTHVCSKRGRQQLQATPESAVVAADLRDSDSGLRLIGGV